MELNLSLIQERDVSYKIRQGNSYVLPIVWEQETALSTIAIPLFAPIDISGFSFFAQIRIGVADDVSAAFFTFSQTPDANQNYFIANVPTATTTFFLSDELTRSMKQKNEYFLEVKMRDAGGNNIESVVIIFKIAEEYARATI